jgi:hypothetical protein
MNVKESRILLRLTKPLHTAVKARALQEGISVNSLLEQIISEGISHPLANNITKTIIQRAQDEYHKKVIGLLLFGSQARGDSHDRSDTDFLLVISRELTIERNMYRVWDQFLPEGISLHIGHLPHNPSNASSLWLECALDAKILFDPTGAIKNTISAIRDFITSGAVVRRVTHGQGYWVHR